MVSDSLNLFNFQGIIHAKSINQVLEISQGLTREARDFRDFRNLRKLNQPFNLGTKEKDIVSCKSMNKKKNIYIVIKNNIQNFITQELSRRN